MDAIGWADIITEALIALVVLVAVPYAIKYFNIKIDDKTRGYVEAAIAGAIRHGVVAASDSKDLPTVVKEASIDPLVRNSVAGLAGDYLDKTIPEGLQRLGITGPVLTQIILARMDKELDRMSSDIQGTVDSVAEIKQTEDSGISTNVRIAASQGTSSGYVR